MSRPRDYTQLLFLANRVLYSPLEALFTLLIFILSKELNATAFQLTILACAKPIVSLFAFNTSSYLVHKPHQVRHFLMTGIVVGAFPCLLFPFVHHVWFYIFSYTLFMTALRASYPAWIEILKNQVGLNKLGGIVAKGSSINYFMIIFIPLLLVGLLDREAQIWKGLFFCFALLSLLNVPLLFFLKVKPSIKDENTSHSEFSSIWKEGWKLIKENRYFTHYQALFFLGGAGLVAVQPVLPIYFKETLHLSYTQLILAFSLCKGTAFICSSPLWVRWAKGVSLYLLNGAINLLSSLFIGLILASSGETHWLFLAYLMYGAMQAGCELSWNLSGPIFAQEKESTFYSSMNLLFVGLRGCLCPFVGQLIFSYSNAFGVFVFAGSLCLVSLFYAIWLEFRNHLKIIGQSL